MTKGDEAASSPSKGEAPSAASNAGHPGDRVFLGRPEPDEGPVEFTRRFLEALLGKDDPRVKNYRPKSDTDSEGDQR